MTKLAITLGIAVVLVLGAVGATALSALPVIPTEDIRVESEVVEVKQVGNEIVANIPWKGEAGLTVKYNMGAPDIEERVRDERKKQAVVEQVSFNGSEGLKIDILLSEKPATNSFCYTIEGWEDYNWYRQPPLTEEATPEAVTKTETEAFDKNGKRVLYRPWEIVGSYAVYHKTKRNHVKGGIDYGTGKFLHIPYPYVWEVGKEDQKVRADDFTFDQGQLCVIAPQDFLDKADYTNGVRIDPNFGLQTPGGSQTFSSAPLVTYSDDAGNGTLDSISSYHTWYGLDYSITHAIYDGATDPTTLLAEDASGASIGGATGWKTSDVSTSITSGTRYWLGFWNSNVNGDQYYDSGATNQTRNDGSGETYHVWPASFANTFQFDRVYSVYGSYTESVSATSTCPISGAGVSMCNGQVNINDGGVIIQ